MVVRFGLWRKLSTEELMLLNCGVGEDSWESLKTAWRPNQSILKEISSEYSLEGLMLKLKLQYFGHLMQKLTHWNRPRCWERLKAERVGGDRKWDGWMTSPTQWIWFSVNSRSRWWTGMQSMRSQRVRHDWVTELTDYQGNREEKFGINCLLASPSLADATHNSHL